MPEAVLLELVVAHLDHELGPERGLLELAGAPAARLGEAAFARLVHEWEHLCGDLVVSLRADRGGAHVVEVPVVGVEPEQQRRDRVAAALLPADARDDAVRRLVRLHLHDAVARAGEVRQSQPLRDHAVEAGGLERAQPFAALLGVVRDGGEREARCDSLELRPPLLDRPLVYERPVPEQEIEGDEGRGDLTGQLPHPALRRMEPHLHGVEVELPAARDHDLAVQR